MQFRCKWRTIVLAWQLLKSGDRRHKYLHKVFNQMKLRKIEPILQSNLNKNFEAIKTIITYLLLPVNLMMLHVLWMKHCKDLIYFMETRLHFSGCLGFS